MPHDFRPQRDADHPVRWTPASGQEDDQWLSVADATDRLSRYYNDPVLEPGQTLRTPFAFYRLDHAPGCTTAPHPDRECAPELDRLSDPHDCEPTDDGAACRICGLPAERDDITPAELVALIASQP